MTSPVGFPSTHKHPLRVVDPDTLAVVATSDVGLGGEDYARRVRLPIAVLYAFGFRVEVYTRGRWRPRRLIRSKRRGEYYLRLPLGEVVAVGDTAEDEGE